MSKILFLHEVYKRILGVHGVILELGSRWGQNLVLFQHMRHILEPYNFSRRIVGFDTWAGFPSVHAKDGNFTEPGGLGVTAGYQGYLQALLQQKQRNSALTDGEGPQLVVGNVVETVPRYLAERPETVVALAYFDMDLYEGTKACLEALVPRMPRGAVMVFDELCHSQFPGETLAVLETLRLNGLRLERLPYCAYQALVVVE